MSKTLVDAIGELVAALEANTAALRGGGAPAAPVPAVTVPPPQTPPPAVKKAPPPPQKAALTYEGVRPLALQLAQKKGRDALVALLAKFGVKAGPELPAEKFAEFVAEATAELQG